MSINLEFARRRMVEQQVRCWEVYDPSVLAVLESIARDRFVPAPLIHLAYADTAIPLPCGQRMMMPIVEGRILDNLRPGPEHSVLEVGTGSGFLAACLAKMSDTVISIDIHGELVEAARKNLARAEAENVSVLQMDATSELPDGEFDAIAITASMPRFDARFLEVLKPGGRLFAIVGEAPVMEARIITRGSGGEVESEAVFETVVAPLENLPSPVRFVF